LLIRAGTVFISLIYIFFIIEALESEYEIVYALSDFQVKIGKTHFKNMCGVDIGLFVALHYETPEIS